MNEIVGKAKRIAVAEDSVDSPIVYELARYTEVLELQVEELKAKGRLNDELIEKCAKIAETTEPFPPGASVSPMDSTERWMVRNMRERIAAAIREQTEKRNDDVKVYPVEKCERCGRVNKLVGVACPCRFA